MTTKHTYFSPTTLQQRKLLFETWEQTHDVAESCQKAHVGKSTFYNWKRRFEQHGYDGLKNGKRGRPTGSGSIEPSVRSKVLEMYKAHPDWGKRRLTDELAKANNWVSVMSPNSVMHILQEAGYWKSGEKKRRKNVELSTRTADYPGQTVNVDLLFVPLKHETELKLPAVSGSSGRLVIERIPATGEEASCPGQVFANPEISYTEAMHSFVEASAPISGSRQTKQAAEKVSQREQIRQLRQEQADLRTKRQQVRQKRHIEDAEWRKKRKELSKKRATDTPKVRTRWGSAKQKAEQRRALRVQRQQQLTLRQKEDEQWRLDRQALREKMKLLPLASAWIAVLLITDNCSRQCLGLPVFLAGNHVTAEMIVTALRTLLPAHLQFLISDRGVHFTAQVFQQLAIESNFVHVLIARHRPQSNGIAERFVRTIKQWLADKTWSSDKALENLLATFLLEFNNRPHQGLPIPGLSPNEYAKRIWLM